MPVIRYEGPRRAGDAGDAGATARLQGMGLGESVALVTDGRFSGGGRRVHRPRQPGGGGGRPRRRAAGDLIEIDLDRRTLGLLVDPAEVQRRLAAWTSCRTFSRWLRRYARLVSSASTGAVFWIESLTPLGAAPRSLSTTGEGDPTGE